MEELILEIVNNYGILVQIKHWYTEVFELTKEIADKENSRDIITPIVETMGKICMIENNTQRQKIKSELADNFNFLRQIQYYYGISDQELIEEQKFKNKRTLKEMRGENNE